MSVSNQTQITPNDSITLTAPTSDSNRVVISEGDSKVLLAAKGSITLTAPTSDSNRVVSSEGARKALLAANDSITLTAPTPDANPMVSSEGDSKVLLAAKGSITLTAPTSDSNRVVISEGARKALLLATVACGILYLIPPLRFAGILAARSIGILSSLFSGVEIAANKAASRMFRTFLIVARIGLLTLGLAGIIASMPLLLIISLGIDIGVQITEMITALAQERFLAGLIHFGILCIDILFLAALTTGAVQAMIAALCIGALMMLALTGYACWKKMPLETICFLSMAALGIANAVELGKSITQLNLAHNYKSSGGHSSSSHPTQGSTQTYTNNHDYPETAYIGTRAWDNSPPDVSFNGHGVVTILPGETVTFTYNPNQASLPTNPETLIIVPSVDALPGLVNQAVVSVLFIGADMDNGTYMEET